MMTVGDLFARAKNMYVEEDYFTLNVRNGVIRNPSGTRTVGIPQELIEGLHIGLDDETASAAPLVLYSCGKWWGKQFVRRHNTEIRQFYSEDAGELPLGFYLQVLRRVWALHGWGKLEISFDRRDRGFLEARVGSALYSDVVGNIGRTSDHLIAGMLAAVIGDLAGRELECVETSCKSRGDQTCIFLLGLKPRIETVSAWVRQGRTHAAILAAVDQGEVV